MVLIALMNPCRKVGVKILKYFTSRQVLCETRVRRAAGRKHQAGTGRLNDSLAGGSQPALQLQQCRDFLSKSCTAYLGDYTECPLAGEPPFASPL